MDDEPQRRPLSPVDVNRLVEDELAWQAIRIDTGEVPPLETLTPAGEAAVKRRWRIPGRLTDRKVQLAMFRERHLRTPRRSLPRPVRARASRRRVRAHTGSSSSRGDPPSPDDDPEPPRRGLLRLAAPWIVCAGLIDSLGCLLWRWLR